VLSRAAALTLGLGVAFAISRAPLPNGTTSWTRPLLGPNQPLAGLTLAHGPAGGGALPLTTTADASVPLAASAPGGQSPRAPDAGGSADQPPSAAGASNANDRPAATDTTGEGGTTDRAATDAGGASDGGVRAAADGGSAADAPAATEVSTYSVQSGDTLRSIAEHFGIDVPTLLASNDVDDPDTVLPGRQLRILPVVGVEHVVQPDETLAEIAWAYQVELSALLAYDHISDPNLVTVGTHLVIPGGKLRPEAVARPNPEESETSATASSASARASSSSDQVAASVAPTPRPAARSTATTSPAVAAAPVRTVRSTPTPQPALAAASPGHPSDGSFEASVTGYVNGPGSRGGVTASGHPTHWGTVAADPRHLPMGTHLKIEGFGDTVFVVEDTGSAVIGNAIDVWFPDLASAARLGRQQRRVTVLPP
jgi:3D (Asp-Asp-Asp) domain-containing protein/LysM repeat protein